MHRARRQPVDERRFLEEARAVYPGEDEVAIAIHLPGGFAVQAFIQIEDSTCPKPPEEQESAQADDQRDVPPIRSAILSRVHSFGWPVVVDPRAATWGVRGFARSRH